MRIHLRVIRPISPPRQRIIRPRQRILPRPHTQLHDLVFRRRFVNEIADPRMPAGIYLRGIELLVLVVYPSRTQRKLFGHVLVEFVAVPVSADQCAGFSVTYVRVSVQ